MAAVENADLAVARLAGAQRGLVATWQLRPLGLGRQAINTRVKRSQLHRRHRGVYSVGRDRLSREGRWLAAVLACGEHAVLSHRSAVALWKLRHLRCGAVDVTVPGRSAGRRAGIRSHAVRSLDPRDRLIRDGIPVTSLARTFLDYAECSPFQVARRGSLLS